MGTIRNRHCRGILMCNRIRNKMYHPGGAFYSVDVSIDITRRDLVIGIWEVTT